MLSTTSDQLTAQELIFRVQKDVEGIDASLTNIAPLLRIKQTGIDIANSYDIDGYKLATEVELDETKMSNLEKEKKKNWWKNFYPEFDTDISYEESLCFGFSYSYDNIFRIHINDDLPFHM